MIAAAEELGQKIGLKTACEVLGVPRSAVYRAREKDRSPQAALLPRPAPSRKLTPEQRARIRSILNSSRFQDLAPREVYAILLDEGQYLCHWRTMYRILD